MRILLASGNPKKREELDHLLGGLDVEIVPPDAVGGLDPVEEDGATFDQNACKKAVAAARAHGMWALADDSGLAVEALGGAPGVRSARFAGEDADDAKNNAKLLGELADLPREKRDARFICSVVLARPDGHIAVQVQGQVSGRILEEPRGANGFGYDPLFLFTEEGTQVAPGRSFAEMAREEKALISHRGRALQALTAHLPEILARERAARS